ncbi:hypothetical protein MMC18_008963 [Xylographa bjoerkii]|nr:hypothetical protein [Xylographa bjoerkii]
MVSEWFELLTSRLPPRLAIPASRFREAERKWPAAFAHEAVNVGEDKSILLQVFEKPSAATRAGAALSREAKIEVECIVRANGGWIATRDDIEIVQYFGNEEEGW